MLRKGNWSFTFLIEFFSQVFYVALEMNPFHAIGEARLCNSVQAAWCC